MGLLQHRLAVAIVGVAVAATGALFLFGRPQYRPPATKSLPLPTGLAHPAQGWTWPHGRLPGYRFGYQEDRWNSSGVLWADLAPARFAARAAGVDPQSLRVLDAARTLPRRPNLYLLLAGRDARGRTCIGVQPGPAAARFYCPAQLRGALAIVIAAPQRKLPSTQGRDWPLYVDGVVSAKVDRVTVTTAHQTWTDMSSGKRVVHTAGPVQAYGPGWVGWGTFNSYDGQPVPWNARVGFYSAAGKKLASLPLRYTHTGVYVYVVR